ncbi:MAG TPA: Tol-Pal system beta propeller repeat protein TolB, partial [Acidobacteriota bacterium]|nr:Tol-Pal system beta propeller repeat protein TolB [Acidobacteriota bacterium]
PCISQTQEEKPPAVGGTIEGGFKPLPVLIPGPFVENAQAAPLAQELQKTLSDDLYYSDLFEMVDASPYPPFRGDVNLAPWKSSRAKYVVLVKVGLAGDQINVEARFYDLQSEQRIIGKVYKWERKFMRQIAHRFGDEILLHLWGIKGIFTSKIAFSSDRTGNREVWMMDYDGYNQRQITVSKTVNLSPDLSPDGKKIVYSTYKPTENIVSQVIVLYGIYTGEKKTLFSKGSLNSAPAWSPDGNRITFASNVNKHTDIYVINTDGGGLRQLTFGRSIETSPAWNPKSGQIAFTSDRSGNPMVYVMNDDGTNEQRITFVGEYNESAAWSPDGSKLAYVSRSGSIFDIYVVMDMSSGVVRRLTQNELSNENPVWAPDSRHLAFASNRTGKFQIWSMSVDGTKLRQLTREGNSTSPSWAPGE